jgi:hypothetical protein
LKLVFPNLYVLLVLVQVVAKFFNCLGLNDAFFFICLANGKIPTLGKGATNLDSIATGFQKFTIFRTALSSNHSFHW